MVRKFVYGEPFDTDAVTVSFPAEEGRPAYGSVSTERGFCFSYCMDADDIVFGLGEPLSLVLAPNNLRKLGARINS